MAGKTKEMSLVKQIIRMRLNGVGFKPTARALKISKNTVKTYVLKAEAHPMGLKALLKLEDPELEKMFSSGTPAYKSDRYGHLKEQFPYLAKELKRLGVNRELLYEEYCEGTSDPYSLTQFNHHLRQYLKKENPSMVLTHKPGDKLYIDFAGKTHSYIDRETGEVISVQVFIACLPYSDYAFAMAVPSQRIEDFIYALGCCLKALGGVPQTLVTDNLKSAITKANRYEPSVNKAMEDFANHYGTTVTPTRPYSAQDKALVENQVKMAYNRVYARLRNKDFFDLPSLNQAFSERIKAHNQTMMQERDYCREERFLSSEKETLMPLPQEDYEIKYYRDHKVANNNHIRMGKDKHYYSVPFTYIGEKVSVVYTRSLVRIYCKGDLIATHARGFGKGKYTTKKEHLCSQHQYYLNRSPTFYMQRGYKHSENLYNYMEALFKQDKYPEQLYNTCDGILNLSRKTPADIFIKACDIALEHQNYSFHFLKHLVENNMIHSQTELIEKSLPKHSNIRGAGTYK